MCEINVNGVLILSFPSSRSKGDSIERMLANHDVRTIKVLMTTIYASYRVNNNAPLCG